MNDCWLCDLPLLGLMKSHISKARPQRVDDLAINLTPPMSPFIDASAPALFSSLSVFVFLPRPMREASYRADRTGNQWFHKREAAENVFGKNKFSWGYNGSENETQSTVTSLAHGSEVISPENLTHENHFYEKLSCLFFNTHKWLEECRKHSASRSSVIYPITSERSPLALKHGRLFTPLLMFAIMMDSPQSLMSCKIGFSSSGTLKKLEKILVDGNKEQTGNRLKWLCARCF